MNQPYRSGGGAGGGFGGYGGRGGDVDTGGTITPGTSGNGGQFITTLADPTSLLLQ